jgi:hypothetical protein
MAPNSVEISTIHIRRRDDQTYVHVFVDTSELESGSHGPHYIRDNVYITPLAMHTYGGRFGIKLNLPLAAGRYSAAHIVLRPA